MGQLKPGVTYIYERADGVTYAREAGADPSTRTVIGWDYPQPKPLTSGQQDLADHNEWIKIRLEAKTNPALQKAVDRVKLLYKLSKDKLE